jgi:hypothetical protein
VEPRGFEPLTSAVQRRLNKFTSVRRCSKIPANKHILPYELSWVFAAVRLGWRQVGVNRRQSALLSPMDRYHPPSQVPTADRSRENPLFCESFWFMVVAAVGILRASAIFRCSHILLGESSPIMRGSQRASGRPRSAWPKPKAFASSGERTKVTSDALSQFTQRIAISAPPPGCT